MVLSNFEHFLSVLASLIVFIAIPALSSIEKGAPVCPAKFLNEREQNYPYVVYGNSPARCYVAGRQGPCAKGSVLFAKPKSHLGICSCVCFMSEGIMFDDANVENYRYCINPADESAYVYDKRRGQCYKLGGRGPCSIGEKFTVTNDAGYSFHPKCVREDHSNEPHTPQEEKTESPTTTNEPTTTDSTTNSGNNCNHKPGSTTTAMPTTGKCSPGTIYSTLLNICTDMNFHGLNGSNNSNSSSGGSNGGKCPPGTIYSTLLNICTDMNFHGLNGTNHGGDSNNGNESGSKCPPGTIYSTLLNICTDMNFHGLSQSNNGGWRPPNSGSRCPPGTIYSTLLNICTDMNFKGLSSSTTGWKPPQNKCPRGKIYSTLLNRCTDMNFRGIWPLNRL